MTDNGYCSVKETNNTEYRKLASEFGAYVKGHKVIWYDWDDERRFEDTIRYTVWAAHQK